MGRGRKPMSPELKRRLLGQPPGPAPPRPPPNPGIGESPAELSDDEKAVWRQVASVAGHLTPMDRINLAELAIHTVRARQYNAVVQCDGLFQRDADHGGHKRIHPAVRAAKAEAEFVAALSVKLRLTPQSVNTPQAPQPDTRGEFERMLDDPYPGCYGLAPADFDGLARKLMAEGRPLPRYLVEMLVKREPRSNN